MGIDRVEAQDKAWRGPGRGSPGVSVGGGSGSVVPPGRQLPFAIGSPSAGTGTWPLKELVSKLAWAVGSTTGQPYASTKSPVRRWALALALNMEKGTPPGESPPSAS